MKRKSIIAIVICLMISGILAGCGQSGVVDATGQTDKEETAEEDTSAEKEVVNNTEEAEFDTTAAENSLKEMSDALSSFLWATMMKEAGYSPLEAGDIKLELTDEEKIRAAVLACEPDGVIDSTFVLGMGGFSEDKSAETGPNGDGFHGVSVSGKDVDKNCLDLFGTKADLGALPTGPKCDLHDAALYRTGNDSVALIVDKEEETETDFKNQECTVTEEDGKYIGKVNVFWGYWGELEQKPGYSNYVATYELEPNNESKYGMVITSISFNRKDDDLNEQSADKSAEDTEVSIVTGVKYYGVFVKAFKDEKDCDKTLSELKDAGFSGCRVVYTPDFEELNPEPYYVVTAGLFTTEEAANEALDKAKTSGFSDAYVKYAGLYRGE